MSRAISLKQRLMRGDVVFGPWSVIPSGAVMNIVSSAGFDFVIIDLEHGPTSFETAEEMVRAAQSEGASPIIRLGHIPQGLYVLLLLEAGIHIFLPLEFVGGIHICQTLLLCQLLIARLNLALCSR